MSGETHSQAQKESVRGKETGSIAQAAEAQEQRGTSSGFSWTYWMACRILSVSSTFLPKARLLIVACWMMPCAQMS